MIREGCFVKITEGGVKKVMKKKQKIAVPSLPEIQQERKRIRRKEVYRQSLRGTISVLLVVAAVAVRVVLSGRVRLDPLAV